MEKLVLILLILTSTIFAAEKTINENEIFIQEGKAFYLTDDKIVNGTVIKEKDGLTIYSTYVNGIKTKEKILNANREIVSSYSFDNNGLISGKVVYKDDYGVYSESTYEKGIRNGYSKSKYYEDVDYEGTFASGIAHGKIKFLDANYSLQEKTFSNGVISTKIEKNIFEDYFAEKFVAESTLKINKDLAEYKGSKFTGFAFKALEGYITSGTYYKNGVKKAYFEFESGFMTKATLYTTAKDYVEYKFLSYAFLKGMTYTKTTFENGIESGPYSTYYEDGWRFEGTFKDGKLFGKGYYYDENNKITEVHDYLNDTYTSVLYFDYDKKIVEGTLQGKKLNGEWIKTGKAVYYTRSGALDEEIVYDGLKGYTKLYYESGKLKKEGYVDSYTNYYVGEVKEYYENGVIKAKLNYLDGYLNGKQYYYDETGKEIKVENYDYGNIKE